MAFRRCMLVGVMALSAVLSTRASAEKEPSEAEIQKAVDAYQAGDYKRAAGLFSDLYRRTGQPHLLYAQAQAERLGGDCQRAIRLYEEYLESDPPEENLVATRDAIAGCRAAQPEEEPAEPPPSPREEPAPAEAVASPERPRPSGGPGPWYSDGWGGTLTVAGLAAAGVGGFMVRSARQSLADAPDASEDLGQYRQRAAQDRRAERIGWGVVGAGTALFGLGVVRYLTRDSAAPSERSVAVSRDGSSLGVVFAGTF